MVGDQGLQNMTDLFQSTLTPVSHERPGGLLEQAIVRGTLAFGFSP